MSDYLRDPAEIYRRSFAAIRAECDLARLPADIARVALRLVHACGMPDIIDDLAFTPGAADRGLAALEAGGAVLCDAPMVAQGIQRHRLRRKSDVICTLDTPETVARATAEATTRAAAAVAGWQPMLAGSVVAIGNAPTALFRLLDELAGGAPRPALILGFPVGFVGAAESKEALATNPFGVPFITLRGRRGGSGMAVAAVNALGGNPEEPP
ncbi:MAG: precorrin-8X methylmutase [Alphaproteobacteria bacterium]|nr:precorrin-8X methylmutase [Alphaproteobacteria bacterium]